MKQLRFSNLYKVLFILSFGLVITACDDDDDEKTPAPSADFTFEITGTSVKFTNTSTDGSTYAWDFGDGTTSTDESPTHDYGKFAGFVVELIATNESGFSSKSAAVQVVAEITIDGDMSDWSNIAALSTKNADTNPDGVVTTVKAVSDLNNIYFYMEGTDDLFGFVQLYINSDGDASTGWATKNEETGNTPLHPSAGSDFELDAGPYDGVDVVELWPWVEDLENNPDRLEWNFEGTPIEDASIYIKPIKTGNAVEFALVRSKVPGLASVISFALGDVKRDPIEANDWIEHGYLPNPDEDYIQIELFK